MSDKWIDRLATAYILVLTVIVLVKVAGGWLPSDLTPGDQHG